MDMRFGTRNVRSKMDFGEIGWDGMDWIDLAQDRVQSSWKHGDERSGSIICWEVLE
jgi:hypothetical protein